MSKYMVMGERNNQNVNPLLGFHKIPRNVNASKHVGESESESPRDSRFSNDLSCTTSDSDSSSNSLSHSPTSSSYTVSQSNLYRPSSLLRPCKPQKLSRFSSLSLVTVSNVDNDDHDDHDDHDHSNNHQSSQLMDTENDLCHASEVYNVLLSPSPKKIYPRATSMFSPCPSPPSSLSPQSFQTSRSNSNSNFSCVHSLSSSSSSSTIHSGQSEDPSPLQAEGKRSSRVKSISTSNDGDFISTEHHVATTNKTLLSHSDDLLDLKKTTKQRRRRETAVWYSRIAQGNLRANQVVHSNIYMLYLMVIIGVLAWRSTAIVSL